MRRMVLSGVIALSMLLTLSTTVFADPISDQIQEQQNIISENKNLINGINKTTSSIESKIEAFDDNIAAVNSQIGSNKVKIASAQTEIDKANKDIKAAQDDMAKEQELFNDRIRALYIHGSEGVNGYLNILLKSDGMEDFLSKVGTVKKLADLDNKIIDDLKKKQDVVKSKQSALKTDKAKLEALVADNQDKLAKLNSAKQEQVVLINQSKKEANKYASKIAAANTSIKKIRDSVPKMSPSRGATSISSNSLVAYATNFIGVPYTYGGNGPSTFDCSGFTKYVFSHFGVSLNRIASDQASQGSSVSKDNLAPGDLVFFGSSWNIHHVGIYVGNGCYIHAPYTGTVIQISSLDRSDYYCARRVY